MKEEKIQISLIPVALDDVMPKGVDEGEDVLDSVGFWKQEGYSRHVQNLIHDAQRCHDSMDDFRKRRDRAKNFTYNNQHKDEVCVDGKWMTEEEYIYSQGQIPMTNNLIRRLVNNVVGTYINQDKEPTCTTRAREDQKYGETFSTLIKYNRQLNKSNLLYTNGLEEGLFGGLCVMRHWYGYNPAKKKEDVWQKRVEVNRWFADPENRDERGWDWKLMGEVHDLTFQQVCNQFASGGSYEEVAMKVKALKQEYAYCESEDIMARFYDGFGYSRLKNYEFLVPSRSGLCRVIEIWNKESKTRARCWDKGTGSVFVCDLADITKLVDNVNNARIQNAIEAGMNPETQKIGLISVMKVFSDTFWYYRFVTPTGKVLDEGESPYVHGEHPYTVFAYPFIDGEIHSFVDNMIDQQKYVNRLITMQDWIMKSSAKGVLLAPEGSFDDMDPEEVAEAWARFDGVIMYKPKPGVPIPQQISVNSTNIGIHELLATELKLFEDISGVNGAMQGKGGYSATSGILYAQQTQNGTTSLMPTLQAYSEFILDGAYKTLKLMQQYYSDERIQEIAGEDAELKQFDVEHCRNLEMDISVVESQSSPNYRQVANMFLLEMAKLFPNQFTPDVIMQAGDFPYADKVSQLLQVNQQKQEEAMQAQQQAIQGAPMVNQ